MNGNDMLQSSFYQLFYEGETLYAAGDEEFSSRSQSTELELHDQQEREPNYSHEVLILVDNPRQQELDASEGVLLYKILKAVGYDSEQTDIINVGHIPAEQLQNMMRTKTAKYIISFGVPFKKVMLDLLIASYEPVNIQGVLFLLADPLSVVEADVDIKKRLWHVLRTMFQVA